MSFATEFAKLAIAEGDVALKIRFLTLAGTTCLIYDHCVTFEQEASVRFFLLSQLC